MSSSIPGTVAYFLTLMGNTLPTGSMVWFGKQLSTFSAPLTLQVVGIVEGEQEPAEIGPNFKREENYDIACILSSFAGDQDFPTRLQEVMTNWALITVAIGNDPTLGGNVRWAQVHSMTFEPQANQDGMSIGILNFAVACQQRITLLT